MFQPLKHVGKKYKILIAKMVVYYSLVESTINSLKTLSKNQPLFRKQYS